MSGVEGAIASSRSGERNGMNFDEAQGGGRWMQRSKGDERRYEWKGRRLCWVGSRANWRFWMGGKVQTGVAGVELEAQGQVSESKASGLEGLEKSKQ